MLRHLIDENEVLLLSRGMSVHVDKAKIEIYLSEAENIDVKPALGDALFWDISENQEKYSLLLNGGMYETERYGKKLFSGLKVALAYYVYARIVKNGDGNVTRYGYFNKEDEFGSRPDFKEKLMAYNDAFDIAAKYMQECLEFLSANKDTYPLFKKGRVRANGNSYKIVGE